jgi:hypothetical protein
MKRTHLVRVGLVVLALFLIPFLACPAESQIPRGNRFGKRWPQPYSNSLFRQYLTEGSFYHTVTVDSGGSGDFTDLSTALAYVASQNPSLLNQWTLIVYPGDSYAESSLAVPPFTLIQGFTAPGTRSIQPQGRPMIQITGTTGAGVTLSTGSSIADVGLNFTGILTAGYKGIHIPTAAVAATLARVTILLGASAPNVGIDILSITGGSLTLEDTSIQRIGAGMTATRHIFCSSGSATLSGAWLLASSSQAAVVETAGGVIRVLHSRIFGGAAVDLKNTSGTLSADHVSYATESGAISRSGALSPRITLGGSTLPPACTPPELYLDTTTNARLCACTAGNTWQCTALKQP